MAIVFHCEHCGKKIEAAESADGKWGKCPACHNRLYVPTSRSSEELKLEPIDVTAEEREKQLMAETHKLTQDILQEREVPEGAAETVGPIEIETVGPIEIETAGPVFEMSERELTKYIIMYLRLMADSKLSEADRTATLVAPHVAQALKILDRIALSEILEPELADIPQHVLSGSIRALRDEIS